jgi:hypothetical protein
MKRLIFLIPLVIIGIASVVSSCGQAPPPAPIIAPPITHATNLPFLNCNVCHIQNEMTASPFPHTGDPGFEFRNDQCLVVGCHAALPTTSTTGTVTVITTFTKPVTTTVTVS